MYKYLLLLHVIGATIWTGGHIFLSFCVLPRALRERSPEVLKALEGPYERIGMPALVVQVVTGLYLAHRMVPDLDQWFNLTTAPFNLIAAKLICLLLTVALALSARLWVLPRLSPETLPRMAFHVIAVTVLSVLFVVFGVGFRVGGWW